MHNSFSEFDVRLEVEADFSKKYNLKNEKDTDWELPPSSELFVSNQWQDAQLNYYKTVLNAKKSELNDLDLKQWHQHTRNTNHAGLVVPLVRKKINPEFLTQAWCKFYEIVCTYELVPETCMRKKQLHTVHLCEAPGAFITSLNHYLKLNTHNVQWDWLGTTLNPHYEGNKLGQMLNDDRLIQHVLDRWWFGRDGTGDLFNKDNAADLISFRHNFSPVNLVTSDGSIDCQNDPGEQESLVSSLHYCETLVSLSILSPGGNMIIKMFTTLETSSVCLLYLLCCSFKLVDVFKPATSKEGNSEVYVICRGFIGRHQVSDYGVRGSLTLSETLTEMMKHYGADIATGAPLFKRKHIPDVFMKRLQECSNYFKNKQIKVIDRNLKLFKSSSNEMSFITKVKLLLADEYIKRYSLEPIPHDCQIVGNTTIRNWEAGKCIDGKEDAGTFAERCEMKMEGPGAWVRRTKAHLDKNAYIWQQPKPVIWFNSEILVKDNITMNKTVIVVGKPLTTIHSSKFCLGSVLGMWNTMLAIFGSPPPDRVQNSIQDLAGERAEICRLTGVKGGWWTDSWCSLQDAIFTIYRYIASMSPGQNLVICGMPLITRLAVSLVHLIGSRFTQVGFCDPQTYGYTVIFCHLREKEALLFDIQFIKSEYLSWPDDFSLHSLFPVSQLCSGILYQVLMDVNHVYISFTSQILANKMISLNGIS